MSNIEQILSKCDNCKLNECDGCITYSDMQVIKARIKELEAKLEFKKYGDLDEIEFEEYMSHFIPKQKVKDKIEKLKKDYDKKYDLFMGHKFQSKEQQDILKQMRILKELLEEGE